MKGYPFTFTGFDGIEYRANYDPPRQAKPWRPASRVTICRTDGQPVTVARASYPAGYVAGSGDAFAEAYRDSIRKQAGANYREATPTAA